MRDLKARIFLTKRAPLEDVSEITTVFKFAGRFIQDNYFKQTAYIFNIFRNKE